MELVYKRGVRCLRPESGPGSLLGTSFGEVGRRVTSGGRVWGTVVSGPWVPDPLPGWSRV